MERDHDDDTHCCCGCCPSLRAGVITIALFTLIGSLAHLLVSALVIRCDKHFNIVTGDETYPTICFKIDNWFGVISLILCFMAMAVSATLLIGMFKRYAFLLLPYIIGMVANGSAFIVIGGLLTFSPGSQYRLYGSFQIIRGVLVIYFSWLVRRYRRELIYKQANVLTVSTSQTGRELSLQLRNGPYSQFDNQHEPSAIHPLDSCPLPSISTHHRRISPPSANQLQQALITTPSRNTLTNYMKPTAIPRLGVYPQPNPNQNPAIYRPSDFLRPGYMQSVSASRPTNHTQQQVNNPIQSVSISQPGYQTQSGTYSQFGNNLQTGANWHPGISPNLELMTSASDLQRSDSVPPLSDNVQLDIYPDHNIQERSLPPLRNNP